MKKTENKNKKQEGFWKRNWLILLVVTILSTTGMQYSEKMYKFSPYLLMIHLFSFYISVIVLIYINIVRISKVATELKSGGHYLFKAICRPIKAIAKKTASGFDLITKRLGADQEIAIAEKQKKKLEIELMQKRLMTEIIEIEQKKPAIIVPDKTETNKDESPGYIIAPEPECAIYGETVIKYLKEVNWNAFTITQCQKLIHKRFGTAKLVLEILVDSGKLEHVNVGKRRAYRLARTDIQ